MSSSEPLMKGKKGLIMGVANDHSIAWGIARMVHAQGAELAFTYQGEVLKKRVGPLAEKVDTDILLECDVTDMDSVDQVFAEIEKRWGKLDFVVHAIVAKRRITEEQRTASVVARANAVKNIAAS